MCVLIFVYMTRKKLQRFADLKTFAHVWEPREQPEKTLTDLLGSRENTPIVLELACGHGAYTMALAKQFPEKTFIGMDIKGARIWFGAQKALDEKILNALFIRTQIEDIAQIFPPESVDEIWITFPDPFLRTGKTRKRLTSTRFLPLYHSILKKDGILHLKTDSKLLYDYTVEESIPENGIFTIEKSIEDIYASSNVDPVLTTIQTPYEHMHLAEGRTIYYVGAKKI